MMIIPMPMMGGGGSPNMFKAMLILANIVILGLFIYCYYWFIKDTYPGTFWEWSWDWNYYLVDRKSNAGDIGQFFWIPFFVIDGIALFAWAGIKLTDWLDKRDDNK